MAMRKTLTPYLSKGRVLEVATKGGTPTCGVVELHDIVTTMHGCMCPCRRQHSEV